MDKEIVNNLYEFWSYLGIKTGRLTETEEYKAVSMTDSDWPNRIYSISNEPALLTKIISLSQKSLLPNIITITKPNYLNNNAEVQFMFGQKNMALDLQKMKDSSINSENIYLVKSSEDTIQFANTASEAFGYRVDAKTVHALTEEPSRIRIFNYIENDECLGCGIVFFDSHNNAGLHMIGTIPKGRGKGIGKEMTQKLISEAIHNGNNYSVLHASLMGESIYKKLGFVAFGELETYKII